MKLFKKLNASEVIENKQKQFKRDLVSTNKAFLLDIVENLTTAIKKGDLGAYSAFQNELSNQIKELDWRSDKFK